MQPLHHAGGGWAATGRTVLDELAWLCPFHHDQQTHHGWDLRGIHPHWEWHPPPPAAGAAEASPFDSAA